MSRKNATVVVAALAVVTLLGGCSAGGGSTSQGGEASDEPVEINVWSWVADLQTEADAYMKLHPNVTVTVTNNGQAGAQFDKVRNALKAGSGVPDAFFVDSSTVAGFASQDLLTDLGTLGAEDYKKDQLDWAWNQMSVDDALYAMPAGVGPAMLFYRKDLYEKYGVEVPTTWEDFRTAAEKIHAANPDQYIANAPTVTMFMEGMISQTGETMYSVDGDSIGIDLTSPGADRVADFWQGMLDDDLVLGTTEYASNEWSQAIAQENLVSLIGGAWLPLLLQPTVPDTSGQWAVAQLPHWADGEDTAFDAGLAGYAIPKGAPNAQAAADFIFWLTNSEESVNMLVDVQSQFPSYQPVLTSEEFLANEDEFFGGQEVRREYADAADRTVPVTRTPIHDFISLELDTQLAAAAAGQGTISEVLKSVEQKSIEFAKSQGFTVED